MTKTLFPVLGVGVALAVALSGCVVEPGSDAPTLPAQSQGRAPTAAATPTPAVDPAVARQEKLVQALEKAPVGGEVSAAVAAATYRKADWSK